MFLTTSYFDFTLKLSVDRLESQSALNRTVSSGIRNPLQIGFGVVKRLQRGEEISRVECFDSGTFYKAWSLKAFDLTPCAFELLKHVLLYEVFIVRRRRGNREMVVTVIQNKLMLHCETLLSALALAS